VRSKNPTVKTELIPPSKVASIDIGTHTILLLIAEWDGDNLKPLVDVETIVRLGEGLHTHRSLSEEAMDRGLQALVRYMERCQIADVRTLFAVGTNVLREARNAAEFVRRVHERLGLSIEVISGEEEALYSFLAVTKDLGDLKKPTLVIDVGGGSTELILGRGGQIEQWVSLPLGAVRCTEQFLHSDPVQDGEWRTMERAIREKLVNIPRTLKPVAMVLVGGTATTLASVEQGLEEFVTEKIHHFILTREALKNQLSLYRSRTIAERKTIHGLPPARADVILAGGTILYMAMEELDCSSAIVSCHGVRYGALYKKLTGN
jgi:exopolyphosphatase/guanosine-5'-triphosphate,3'-diphosphate pyrophosphatase